MVVSSVCSRLVFSHCVNCVLYKVMTYASCNTLNQTANLCRSACMYVMLPHISKTGDTTHGASFHATVSIILLIHAVLMAAGSQKHNIRYISLNTIMTPYKLTHISHTNLPQYQQYKINIFWKTIRLQSLTHDHSYETVGELCSINTSLYQHLIT